MRTIRKPYTGSRAKPNNIAEAVRDRNDRLERVWDPETGTRRENINKEGFYYSEPVLKSSLDICRAYASQSRLLKLNTMTGCMFLSMIILIDDVVAGRRTYVTLQRIGLLPLFYHSSPDLSFLLFVALYFLRRPSVNPLLRKFLLFEVAFFVDNQIDRDHPRLPDKHSAAVERVDNRYRQRERARKKVQKTIPIYVIISMIFTCL